MCDVKESIHPLPSKHSDPDLDRFYERFYRREENGKRQVLALPHTRIWDLDDPIFLTAIIRILDDQIKAQNYYIDQAQKLGNGKRIMNMIALDFDQELPEPLKEKKKRLEALARRFVKGNPFFRLRRELREAVYEGHGEDAVVEALTYRDKLMDDYENVTVFFSGMKGVHVYIPVQPVEMAKEIDKVIEEFFTREAKRYNLLDLASVRRISTRKDRIPFTRHQLTGLFMIPINGKESWGRLIRESERGEGLDKMKRWEHTPNPTIQDIMQTVEKKKQETLKGKLPPITARIYQQDGFKPRPIKRGRRKKRKKGNLIEEFIEALGEPEEPSNYDPNKHKYVKYLCKLHNDTQASLTVYRYNWYCFGCQEWGLTVEEYLTKVKKKEKEGI